MSDPQSLNLLGGDTDADAWAQAEAAKLEELLNGGVDNWDDMEAALIEAQESMEHELRMANGENDDSEAILYKATVVPSVAVSQMQMHQQRVETEVPRRQPVAGEPVVVQPQQSQPPQQRQQEPEHHVEEPVPEPQPEPAVQEEDKSFQPSGALTARRPVSARRNADLSAWQERIKDLITQIASLRKQAAESVAKNEELQGVVSNLRSELAREAEKSMLSEKEREDSGGEIERLKKSLDHTNAVLAQRDVELEGVKENMQKADSEFLRKEQYFLAEQKKLADRMAELETQKAVMKGEVENHVVEMARLKEELAARVGELAAVRHSIAKADERSRDMEIDNARIKEQNEQLKAQMGDKNKELATVRAENVVIQEKLTVYEHEKQQLKATTEKLEKKQRETEREFEAKIDALAVATANDESQDAEALKAEFKQEMERYAAMEVQAETAISDLKARLSVQKATMEEKMAHFRSDVDELVEAKRSLENEVQKLGEDRKASMEQLADSAKETKEVTAALVAAQEAVQQLKLTSANLVRDKEQALERAAALEAEKVRMEEEVKEMKEQQDANNQRILLLLDQLNERLEQNEMQRPLSNEVGKEIPPPRESGMCGRACGEQGNCTIQ